MRPGEVLVLCTDGILERRDPAGEFFGTERLKAVVAGRRDGTAGEILERLFGAAIAFGDGRPWEDDATAVVVRRRTSG
jgi:sigma-B regulation protein RsbU (phosphoserine phosphatase)